MIGPYLAWIVGIALDSTHERAANRPPDVSRRRRRT